MVRVRGATAAAVLRRRGWNRGSGEIIRGRGGRGGAGERGNGSGSAGFDEHTRRHLGVVQASVETAAAVLGSTSTQRHLRWGSGRWMNTTGCAERDSHGCIGGMHGIHRWRDEFTGFIGGGGIHRCRAEGFNLTSITISGAAPVDPCALLLLDFSAIWPAVRVGVRVRVRDRWCSKGRYVHL